MNPSVFTAAAKFGGGEFRIFRRDARERTGENFDISAAFAKSEKNVVLTAFPALPILKGNGLSITRLRLRHIACGVAEDFRANGVDFFLRREMAITSKVDAFAVEPTDCEFLDVGKHQFALVVLTQPIGRKRR